MNRRDFLRVTLAAAAVVATPVLLTKAMERELPVVYGDGVHDDTEGLQAALDGRDFVCRDGCVKVLNGSAHIVGGNYRISRTLRVNSERKPTINFCSFTMPDQVVCA
jgi:TAT (twin-arginine translocation) pathway signal sequence.